MTDNFWNPQDPQAQSGDPNLRVARAGEVHQPPPVQEWGEGVITGHAPDHYVHLANGAVIPGTSVGTHYDDPQMGLVPIMARFPAGKELPR